MKNKDSRKTASLPNEFHRHHRWQRGLVVENKKGYKRKAKNSNVKKEWGY